MKSIDFRNILKVLVLLFKNICFCLHCSLEIRNFLRNFEEVKEELKEGKKEEDEPPMTGESAGEIKEKYFSLKRILRALKKDKEKLTGRSIFIP